LKKGKVSEHRLISRILKEDELNVFLPVVDEDCVDFIVKNKHDAFIQVQVKSRRSLSSKTEFFVREFRERKNFVIMFHLVLSDEYWIIPSNIIREKCMVIGVKEPRHIVPVSLLVSLFKYKHNGGVKLLKRCKPF